MTCSRAAMAPNSVLRPVLTTRTRAVPLRTMSPERRCLSARQAGHRPQLFRALLDLEGLSRHAGFTYQKVLRLHHDAIGRDQVASRQQDKVPGTIRMTGSTCSKPSRRTRAVRARRFFRSSIAVEAGIPGRNSAGTAQYDCRMIAASTHCCRTREMAAQRPVSGPAGFRTGSSSSRSAVSRGVSATLFGQRRPAAPLPAAM